MQRGKRPEKETIIRWWVLTGAVGRLGCVEIRSQQDAKPMSLPNHIAPCGGDCHTCSAAGSCPDRVVCRCLQVVEETVIVAIRTHGARTVRELKTLTGAGDGCMC